MFVDRTIEPFREIVSRDFERVSRLVSGIYLCMNHMRFCECDSDKIMHVSWEASETCFVAHEAMDEYQHQAPSPCVALRRIWHERLR
jgi:hypothetical protein